MRVFCHLPAFKNSLWLFFFSVTFSDHIEFVSSNKTHHPLKTNNRKHSSDWKRPSVCRWGVTKAESPPPAPPLLLYLVLAPPPSPPLSPLGSAPQDVAALLVPSVRHLLQVSAAIDPLASQRGSSLLPIPNLLRHTDGQTDRARQLSALQSATHGRRI